MHFENEAHKELFDKLKEKNFSGGQPSERIPALYAISSLREKDIYPYL